MAGGYLTMRMKRKEVEQVSDDFSDFSLSSPARKIRRLDAELPPIMEEEEPEIPVVFDESMGIGSNMEQLGGGAVIEELPSESLNEERALVLFKPINTPLLHSPSNFSFSISPDFVSGFKNQGLWSNQSNPVKPAEDEASMRDKNTVAANESLAVVPWVPSQLPPTPGMEVSQAEVSELMEDEETEATTMDIEDNNVGIEQGQENQFGEMTESEGLHQWQQQHCMIPQLPQNTPTPIVWFR